LAFGSPSKDSGCGDPTGPLALSKVMWAGGTGGTDRADVGCLARPGARPSRPCPQPTRDQMWDVPESFEGELDRSREQSPLQRPHCRHGLEKGALPKSRARTTALKPPVAEGGPSAIPMGEPPGLVPGGRGERGSLYRLLRPGLQPAGQCLAPRAWWDRRTKDGGDIAEEAVEGRSGHGSPSAGRGERSPEAERIWHAGTNPCLQERCPRVLRAAIPNGSLRQVGASVFGAAGAAGAAGARGFWTARVKTHEALRS